MNYIDTEEYPSTEKIKEMCVKMLGDLWHAGKPIGLPKFISAVPRGSVSGDDCPSKSRPRNRV